MANQITYGDSSRQAILRGVNSLTNAVKVTLGPKGRNVILDKKFGSPTITKDGVTVAKEIDLNAIENMGAQMVKEGDEGFNAQTEQYENLVKAGVIDPTKVVRSALQNAASVAGLLLTTEAVISQIPEDHKQASMSQGGME